MGPLVFNSAANEENVGQQIDGGHHFVLLSLPVFFLVPDPHRAPAFLPQGGAFPSLKGSACPP